MGIFIDFYCDKSQLKKWKAWCKDNEVDEDEPKCRTGYIRQGAAVMDCHFRLLCIAAYRRTKSSDQKDYQGFTKDEILKTLLRICPPDSSSMKRSQQDRASRERNRMMNAMWSLTGIPGGRSRYDAPPQVDLAALESDHGLRRKLAAIGLEPMADWVSYGCQTSNIPGSIITACARMFTSYKDLVPITEKDLEGTPYAETTTPADNLDSNGCVEYLEELEPAFRHTASFGESCYGQHT